MVVMDQWGSLWGNVFSAATRSWYGWRQSGGGLVGSPAIAVDANGTAWVVVRSSFNALWLTSLAPAGFSGNWTSLGGIVDGDPAIAAPSAGMAYIVARDDIGRVWLVRAVNGAFQDWSLLGGVILGNPTVVAGLNGTAHVIARDPNSYPWVAIINGTTPTWKGTPTALDSPASGIHVNNVVTVTAIRSGQVWSAPFFVASESWGTWSPLGQAATSASAASDETSLAVAARDPAGQLVWYRAGAGWSNYGSLFAGGALSATPTGSATSLGSFFLTTIVSPVGGGSTTPPCPSGCLYASGSQVQLTATPASGYQFTGFTGSVNSSANPLTVTMNSTMTETANFVPTSQYTATTIDGLNDCIQNPQYTTCVLAASAQPYTVTSTINITRGNVTVTGGTGDRTQTKLVRAQAFKEPLISVNAPVPGTCIPGNMSSCGITIRNLTICGSSTLTPGASPVGCPRTQTECGNMVTRKTPPNVPLESDFICEDLQVVQADTGLNPTNPDPFSYGGPYSVTIDNMDLQDAAGHALSLWADGRPGSQKKVNDIFIHHSAINYSEVTGIVYGAHGANYHTPMCDGNPSFKNDTSVYTPRNLRIENNTFTGNNTGAMGGGAVRWVMLRDNTFTNNYVRPRVGNVFGGTIEFDPCADKVHIIHNTFTGPIDPVPLYPSTDGMELYSRSLLIDNNTVSDYPREGITLNSVYDATVTNNIISNNSRQMETGGILVSTAESITGPCGDPRDSQTVTITGNSSTGQPFGVHLHDHDGHSRNTIHNLTISNNSLAPPEVGLDSIVVVNGYVGPPTSPGASNPGPRVLTVKAVAPVTTRCSTPGSQRETFTFQGSDARGTSQIYWVQGIFSIAGEDSDGTGGPDTGAQGCHFIYFPSANVLYLDGPNGGSNWGEPTVVPGGASLSNGYCTIHAGSASSRVTTENYILKLDLDIEFPSSSSSSLLKHIYTITGDDQGQMSDAGLWKYWGWWSTP